MGEKKLEITKHLNIFPKLDIIHHSVYKPNFTTCLRLKMNANIFIQVTQGCIFSMDAMTSPVYLVLELLLCFQHHVEKGKK